MQANNYKRGKKWDGINHSFSVVVKSENFIKEVPTESFWSVDHNSWERQREYRSKQREAHPGIHKKNGACSLMSSLGYK